MTAIVFPFPGNEALAAALAAGLPAERGELALRHFPDGESHLRVRAAVSHRDAIIACTLDRPNDKLVTLYLAASALREQGAQRVFLVAPYLAYMRQDASFNTGEGVTAAYVARWLSGFLDGLVTVDPHLHRFQDLSEIYSIPTRVVAAAPAVTRWIREAVGMPLLVGPDAESARRTGAIARELECPQLLLKKVRFSDADVRISAPTAKTYADRTPVLVDDIVSTAGTMVAAVRQLRAAGFDTPVCVAVHPLFTSGAYEELRGTGVDRIVSCNTVQHQTNGIDLYPDLVPALRDLLAAGAARAAPP